MSERPLQLDCLYGKGYITGNESEVGIMLNSREHLIARDSGSEEEPYVSASEQAHTYIQRNLARGADLVYLRGALLGIQLDFTDSARAEFVDGLEPLASTLLKKYSDWEDLGA